MYSPSYFHLLCNLVNISYHVIYIKLPYAFFDSLQDALTHCLSAPAEQLKHVFLNVISSHAGKLKVPPLINAGSFEMAAPMTPLCHLQSKWGFWNKLDRETTVRKCNVSLSFVEEKGTASYTMIHYYFFVVNIAAGQTLKCALLSGSSFWNKFSGNF